MAKSKKRRKIIVFSLIGLALAGLAAFALLRKREVVITVQTEKVARRNLTELVLANGRIQPVLQVKISAEVSGEIIDLPVKEGQQVNKGDLLVKIKPDFYIADQPGQRQLQVRAGGQRPSEAKLRQGRSRVQTQSGPVPDQARLRFRVRRGEGGLSMSPRRNSNSATHQVEMAARRLASAEEDLDKTTIVSPLTGTISKLNSRSGRAGGRHRQNGRHRNHDHRGPERNGGAGGHRRDRRGADRPGQNVRLEVDAFKDRKFNGTVTEIANSSKTAAYGCGSSQEATKFEVRIRDPGEGSVPARACR